MKEYVLITPARNEGNFLPGLIGSIVSQTVRPTRWVIVSDGSTDQTDDIAAKAAQAYPFVHLIRASGREKRSFGSKALAFMEGYKALQGVQYRYIGNLDGDVTFEALYYQRMLEEMKKNPKLGVASGVCWDKSGSGFKRTNSNLNHAVGAVQFWRRECFEEVGGYSPATVGGVDSLAELTARMRGWETESFPDLPVYHHKPVDIANGRTGVRIAYRAGQTEYHMGTHPLFAFFKAVRWWKDQPVIISVFARLFGYGQLWLTAEKRDSSIELVNFLRNEQMTRLRQVFSRIFSGNIDPLKLF